MTMRKKVANIGLAIFSVIFAVVCVEAGIRLLGIEVNINPWWNYHPVLGWSQVPNGQYDSKYDGEPLHVEFNSLGFRDHEHTIDKPPGTKRIVVIGDSFSEATQVNMNEIYFVQLESLLNKNTDISWEVINLGVGDFGTAQQWLALTEFGLRYSPDVVVHQIFPLNDICNNSIELFGLCKSDNDRYRPYFVQEKGGLRLTSAQPFRNFLRRYLLSYGLVERYLLQRRGRPQYHDDIKYRQRYLENMGFPSLEVLLFTYVRDEDQIEEIRDGWGITEGIIRKIASLCRENKIQYLPVVIPFEGRLDSIWEKFLKIIPPDPAIIQDYPEKRFAQFFSGLGVAPVLLRDVFQEHEDKVLPYRDGHLNPEGHRIVAEEIYRKIGSGGIQSSLGKRLD